MGGLNERVESGREGGREGGGEGERGGKWRDLTGRKFWSECRNRRLPHKAAWTAGFGVNSLIVGRCAT